MLTLLLEGFLSGLLIAMPMGAIGVLCLRYILVQGRVPGFAAGLGIATADALAAFIGALGLTIATNFVKDHDSWMRFIGALILIGFGLFLVLSKKTKFDKNTEKGLLHIFFIMFVITLTNPLTLISFIGIFSSIGLNSLDSNFPAAFLLSIGVFVGSMSWWLLLIGATFFFQVTEKWTRLINEVAGSLLILIGVVVCFDLGYKFFVA